MAVTGMIIAIGFALFGLAVKYLPIFPTDGDSRNCSSRHENQRRQCTRGDWNMPEIEPSRVELVELTHSLSAKLNALLLEMS